MEALVTFIAFSSSALLGLMSFIFSSGQFVGQPSTFTFIEPAFGTFFRYQVMLESEISISIKLLKERKHEELKNAGRCN